MSTLEGGGTLTLSAIGLVSVNERSACRDCGSASSLIADATAAGAICFQHPALWASLSKIDRVTPPKLKKG